MGVTAENAHQQHNHVSARKGGVSDTVLLPDEEGNNAFRTELAGRIPVQLKKSVGRGEE